MAWMYPLRNPLDNNENCLTKLLTTEKGTDLFSKCCRDDLKDMNYPGSNLHALSGDRKGQYSVKISGNWRVIFEFVNGDAYVVDYDDYH